VELEGSAGMKLNQKRGKKPVPAKNKHTTKQQQKTERLTGGTPSNGVNSATKGRTKGFYRMSLCRPAYN